ncbi:MAG: butyrate kinase [Firmicutes bacterium]|nr:butyrate kinase [Bacillota bacterium]MDH7495515.1 butyrate kinase [Bacillota bacterium]
METLQVLVINPGSTATRIALYTPSGPLFERKLSHDHEVIASFPGIMDQFQYRLSEIMKVLREEEMEPASVAAVVARGGLLRPVAGGTYLVNERMLEDLRNQVQGPHASNLGGLIARLLADGWGVPAFVVDPVSCDEFEPLARVSGVPELPRRSLSHALNIKAAVRRASREMGADPKSTNYVVAHLGGGISVAACRGERIIDVNNANEQGPFSPERAGGVPAVPLARLAFSGRYTKEELVKKLVGRGGLMAYLGTSDAVEVERRISQGDERARLAYEAMAYQVAKEIGAMACVLRGEVRAVLITGGLANAARLVDMIRTRVQFVAEVKVYPGEEEMEALAMGAFRVLLGEEEAKVYV